jgi:hypothetical protein
MAFLLTEFQSGTEHHMERNGESTCLCVCVLCLIKVPGYSYGGYALMTLSNLNHAPKALPRNSIIGLSFYTPNTSQWELNF